MPSVNISLVLENMARCPSVFKSMHGDLLSYHRAFRGAKNTLCILVTASACFLKHYFNKNIRSTTCCTDLECFNTCS